MMKNSRKKTGRRTTSRHDWAPYRDAERAVRRFSPHAPYRLALAYANSYEVGMSSLGFQRVHELIHATPEWACERFFLDGTGMPLSVETGTAMDDFGCVAFSVSFEEDYIHLLQMLDRARIPLAPRGPRALASADRDGWLVCRHQPVADGGADRCLCPGRGREPAAGAARRPR